MAVLLTGTCILYKSNRNTWMRELTSCVAYIGKDIAG